MRMQYFRTKMKPEKHENHAYRHYDSHDKLCTVVQLQSVLLAGGPFGHKIHPYSIFLELRRKYSLLDFQGPLDPKV